MALIWIMNRASVERFSESCTTVDHKGLTPLTSSVHTP